MGCNRPTVRSANSYSQPAPLPHTMPHGLAQPSRTLPHAARTPHGPRGPRPTSRVQRMARPALYGRHVPHAAEPPCACTAAHGPSAQAAWVY